MKTILLFLAAEGYFFLQNNNFRIINSDCRSIGEGKVHLSNGSIVISLLIARDDDLALSFVSCSDYPDRNFFPWGVIRELMTGEQGSLFPELTEDELELVRDSIPRIESLLSGDRRQHDYRALKQIRKDILHRRQD